MIVGGLLLIFGLQWLRKAILRAAGLKALHDERETFDEERAAARAAGDGDAGFDAYSFTIAFKGVLLEGLEVAFIVLTFGANQHNVGLAAAAAGVAVLVVVHRRRRGPRAAGAGAGERAEVRGRGDAHLVRDVLGRGGRRRRLAGRRRRAAGDHPADAGVALGLVVALRRRSAPRVRREAVRA